MTVILAFHATYGLTTEAGQRTDVERQAREWAAAEPKVTGCRIVSSHHVEDHHSLWSVTVELSFIEDAQQSLWGAA